VSNSIETDAKSSEASDVYPEHDDLAYDSDTESDDEVEEANHKTM
jgi:hypothetical protein